jgi:hypothetical protein
MCRYVQQEYQQNLLKRFVIIRIYNAVSVFLIYLS